MHKNHLGVGWLEYRFSRCVARAQESSFLWSSPGNSDLVISSHTWRFSASTWPTLLTPSLHLSSLDITIRQCAKPETEDPQWLRQQKVESIRLGERDVHGRLSWEGATWSESRRMSKSLPDIWAVEWAFQTDQVGSVVFVFSCRWEDTLIHESWY